MPAAAKREAKRATENSVGKKQAGRLKKSQKKEDKLLRCREP